MEFDIKKYWNDRYANNGNSGNGSYGKLAIFKANIINEFIKIHNISSVSEFGCGDGSQLNLFECPVYYGYDISSHIINKLKLKYVDDETKKFDYYENYDNKNKFDLSLSLDVIFHIVNDDDFNNYMNILFESSNKYVIIYSSDGNKIKNQSNKIKHLYDRNFTNWINNNRKDFILKNKIYNIYPYEINDPINTSISDFYIYEKIK